MYEDELPCGYNQNPQIPQFVQESQDCLNSTECCENTCTKFQTPKQQILNKQATITKRKVKVCYKCKINPSAILYKSEAMCKQCSLRNVEYKCRVNLQNKIKIKGGQRLLVCTSGGMNSICLINILKELEIKFQKHLLFSSMEVLHIDLSILSEQPQIYRQNLEKLYKYSKQRDFKLTIVPVTAIYEQKQEKFENLMKGFCNAANQADLIDMFIDRIVRRYSNQNSLIVKGTSGQKISASIFKYLVKGKGGNLDQLNWRNNNIIYPLREHLTRELQFYFYTKKLQQYSFSQPSILNTNNTQTNEIDSILEDFMDSIQDTYTHTCPTILRTSEKIKSLNDKKRECRWCLSNCEQQMCLRCRRILDHWCSKQDINKYLPQQFAII